MIGTADADADNTALKSSGLRVAHLGQGFRDMEHGLSDLGQGFRDFGARG